MLPRCRSEDGCLIHGALPLPAALPLLCGIVSRHRLRETEPAEFRGSLCRLGLGRAGREMANWQRRSAAEARAGEARPQDGFSPPNNAGDFLPAVNLAGRAVAAAETRSRSLSSDGSPRSPPLQLHALLSTAHFRRLSCSLPVHVLFTSGSLPAHFRSGGWARVPPLASRG